jgi:serine/threonine protein kinase
LSHKETLAAWHRKDVDVHDYYEVLEVIGHGHMGEISCVTRKPKAWERHLELNELPDSLRRSIVDMSLKAGTANNNEYVRCYACKTVSTARMKKPDLAELLNEVSIMRKLDHPNILQLFEVYSTKRKIWLITEMCYGGDLFSRNLDEASTAVVMEQILQAVAYMHNLGVCHSDLKLESEFKLSHCCLPQL